MNLRPLDPQSSALPAAPHPDVLANSQYNTIFIRICQPFFAILSKVFYIEKRRKGFASFTAFNLSFEHHFAEIARAVEIGVFARHGIPRKIVRCCGLVPALITICADDRACSECARGEIFPNKRQRNTVGKLPPVGGACRRKIKPCGGIGHHQRHTVGTSFADSHECASVRIPFKIEIATGVLVGREEAA